MDLDAFRARHEAEHIVAEDRIAALGHLVFQALDIFRVQDENVVCRAAVALRGSGFHLFGCLRGRPFLLGGKLALDEGLDVVDIHLLAGEGRHEREDGWIFADLDEFHHPVVREFEFPVAQAPFQQLAPVRRGLALVGIEFLLDLGAGLGRDHPAQPVAVRTLVLARHDFHHVARLELLADGDCLAVHPAAGAAAAQPGVDIEGEVQHGRAGGQDAQFAGRREDENLFVRRSRHLFGRGLERMLQRVAYRLQPAVHGRLVANTLVGPVRGISALSLDIHASGADLHLEGLALLVFDGDMQGLVAVRARRGEPVAQALRVRFIFLGHVGEHLPAEILLHLGVVLAVDDEADGKDIVDTLERHFLHLHLAVDGVGALGPDLQFVDDARVGELAFQRLNELGRDLLAILLRGFQFVGNGPVLLGIGIAEPDVAQLVVDVVEAKLVRQRHVEHQCLQQLLVTGGLREHLQAAHHLQPVGDLEHGHAGIGRVLDDEALVILRLQACVLGLDGRDLVEPVHEGPDILREPADIHILMGPRGLVQVHGGNAGVREADFVLHDMRDVVRMADERGPVEAGFVLQRLQRHRAGLFNQSFHNPSDKLNKFKNSFGFYRIFELWFQAGVNPVLKNDV